MSEKDLSKAIHELQVHQIELEMQNEELKQARDEAAALHETYLDLYDFAPVGYFTLDAGGEIRRANLAGAALLGLPRVELEGKRLALFLVPGSRTAFADFLADVLVGRATASCGVEVTRADGAPSFLQVEGRSEAAGATCRIAMTDVTDRKRSEEELARHREHLEELVAKRTASLQNVNAALREVIAVNRRTEKELRESEQRLHLAQEAALSGTWERDLRTNEIVWAPELERLYGLPAGYFVANFGPGSGSGVDERFVHPEDLPLTKALLRKAVEERGSFRSEFRVIRDDGETRWMEGVGKVLCDSSGEPVRMVGLNRDITDRKRAEEALRARERDLEEKNEQLRALFDSASAAMALFEAKAPYRTLAHNRRFLELPPEPWRTGGLVGLPLAEYTARTEEDGIAAAFRGVVESGTARSFKEFPYDGMSGGRTWWDWHVSPVEAGGAIAALVLVAIDVSMSVRARQRLETEMFHVQEANRELEAFSYSVSHDLRAPLRAVHGFSSLLESHLGGALDDEGRRLLETVKKNGLLMGSLVDGLVEYTRIRHTQLARARVDMKGLAENVIGELLAKAQRPQVDIRIASLPPAFADRDLVADVLRHLLSNAIRFSAGQPKPMVEVGFEAGPDGPIYFVRDNGIGFDARHAGKLFGVFQRLEGAPELGRTGIGLALVRRIVERHGGWIRAEPALGQGAVFRFSLVPS